MIIPQALWNFLIDTANVIGALGEDEADYIAGDLAEYLGNLRENILQTKYSIKNYPLLR